MLKVYWFGYGGHSHFAEDLEPIIQELGMNLITIHEHENASIKWNRETINTELAKADIIILPCDYKIQDAKSNNKLTQVLSLGKPVICSPLPAYKRIIEKYPKVALTAIKDITWKKQLKLLRDNEDKRLEMGKIAIEAAKEFSIDNIGTKWLDLFNNLEKVDIVIPTYNNLPCLKLCLESIRKCTNFMYNLVIVDNGSKKNVKEYLEQQSDIMYVRTGRLSFSKAVNMGIKSSNSKYVCILNDDTIVSNGWLTKLVKSCGPDVGAVGPLSNCDKGWLHNYSTVVGGIDLLPGVHTVNQIKPIINDIYNYSHDLGGDPEIAIKDWVAFYCTLIPREVINKTGYLDEEFVNSGEDVDLCYRIKKQGYRIIQDYTSFVFHFGAVGRKLVEKENKVKYQKEQKDTTDYLNEKLNKKNVVIYSGHSWERWDFNNVKKGGIGGSENWQIYLAREFDSMGYRVVVFCDCKDPTIMDGNVKYMHYSLYPKYIDENYIDYFITSRITDPLNFPIRSGKNYVMIHDVWLTGAEKAPLYLDKVDKYMVLSEWHKDFVRDFHGIPEEKLELTSNGLDFKRYTQPKKKIERHPHRLFYSSSPDRGLDTLLYLFDFIKGEIPDLELHIYYGFDNWEKSTKLRNDEAGRAKIKELKDGMKKEGVFYHGRVNQRELALGQLSCSLFAYPTDFEETFCITAIEAQKACIPVISTNFAGLKTTVGNSGILIGNGEKGQPYTEEYRKEFVAKCIELLTNEDEYKKWQELGKQNIKKYSWKNVGKKWDKLFKS